MVKEKSIVLTKHVSNDHIHIKYILVLISHTLK